MELTISLISERLQLRVGATMARKRMRRDSLIALRSVTKIMQESAENTAEQKSVPDPLQRPFPDRDRERPGIDVAIFTGRFRLRDNAEIDASFGSIEHVALV